MSRLAVRLFGKISIQYDDRPINKCDGRKMQELLCHLCLYHDRPQARETPAGLLWGDSPTALAKKSLRHTLWQLQTALEHAACPIHAPLLTIDPEWIQLNLSPEVWVDALVLEQAFSIAQGIAGEALSEECAEHLRSAVEVYQGELLEGCYQEWCIYERERFQHMYMALLDKLLLYYEAQQCYENGIAYGLRILRYDRARERTHRQLMRLYYLTGDRSLALRQYERCTAALEEELGVTPSERTLALYQQICADQLAGAPPLAAAPISASLRELLEHLRQLRSTLSSMDAQIEQYTQTVEQLLRPRE